MPIGVDRHALRQLTDGGAGLVEVLPKSAYDEAHLPGARNIPLKKLADRGPVELDPAHAVVVYCYDAL